MISKTHLSDLAILGGNPTFDEKLHVGRPNIGDRDRILEYVNTILDNRWLTNNGPFVQQFEQRVADLIGVKHCIAACNGTVALEIAIRALELKGEVILPSFTFIASAHALQWQEITPVFCDIDPITHTLDPAKVEAMITPRTTAILGVHVWGSPCEVDPLRAIADRHGLRLIFDAAHAFGCSYQGQQVGSLGDAEVFSFHATKFVNTLEGGAIVTNNDELAAKIRLMKNFGFAGYDNVIYIGTNGKMHEMSAAMGLASLESMDRFVAANRHNYHQYRKELADIPGLRLYEYNEVEACNYQYIVTEVDPEVTGIHRDLLIKILWEENILARRYFYPGCHRMEPYRSYFPHAGLLLPNTDQVASRIMILPTGETLTDETLSRICEIVRLAITNGKDLTSKLEYM
jgi:dTDP-4-amino-4,6-dideoxygalactose transaminase